MEADDPAMVHDTVDDRGGHVPVSEHVAPPAELEIRGEDDAAGLVAVRAGLEQEPGPVDVDGQVAELADDDQPGPADRLKLLVEMVLVLGLPQSHDQARGSEEPDGDHAPAGEHADRDGQVGLAAAHVAVKHEVLGPFDELQAFQLPASPVGREQGHAPGRSRPGSCSGGKPACPGSRRRLDSARLAFSFSNRLARKPSWPGVASSRAFPSTLCVNGRLRAKAVTCPGVALATTLPPRLRGWPSCVLMPVPPCICRNVSDSGRPRSPCPRGRVGRMWRLRPGRWSVRRR